MIKQLSFATVIMLAVAGCNEEETVADCTKEDLMSKTTELTSKLQENPAKALEIAGDMQELATKFQGLASGGEPSAETINELCAAYDGLLEKL